MNEKTYPPYRNTKNIDVRFASHLGNISCGYQHLVRAFGIPTFSVDNNDTFEGTEQCLWQIEFQNGTTAIVAENRGFGSSENHYEKSTSWKVNSRDTNAFNWIKSAIRDANPNG
jgi:hypothetical protein